MKFTTEHPEYYNALILEKEEIEECLPAATKAKLNEMISVTTRRVAGDVGKGVEQATA